MRRAVRATFLSVLFVSAGIGSAIAQSPDTEGLVRKQGKLCFARVYDAAHLKSHPNQKMERLFIMVGKDRRSVYWEDPALRGTEESPAARAKYIDGLDETGVQFGGVATFKGAPASQEFLGTCSRDEDKKGALRCGGDCDRGFGDVSMPDEKHLVFSGVPDTMFIYPEDEEKGAAATRRLTLGSDDQLFRLDARPLEECIAEANKTRPQWAQFGPPLRERFKADEPFCLGRDYTVEHLGSHPQQVTASVRVWRSAKQIESDRAKKLLPDWPDQAGLLIGTTTRANGRPVKLNYLCGPTGDQWECSVNLCEKGGDGQCDAEKAENSKIAHCDKTSSRSFFLRRGAGSTVMLVNPSSGLAIDGFCRTDDSQTGAPKTMTDDRFYRLEVMPLSACETF